MVKDISIHRTRTDRAESILVASFWHTTGEAILARTVSHVTAVCNRQPEIWHMEHGAMA